MRSKQELGVELMTKSDEILLQTIEYLESLIVPSKDLGYIFIAISFLRKAMNEGGLEE